MGFGLSSKRGDVLSKTKRFSVHTLAVFMALTPMHASASSAGQGGAQQSAGNSNSLAQGLSSAMGVVSMGLGGLYMAKGAQQLSCCASGCSGSGSAANASKQNLDNEAARKAAESIGPKLKLDLNRYDQGVKNECPQPRLPTGGVFSLMHFFQPPQAHAAAGCLDAMIALATGGLMMLQGLMSLNAANQAGQNASNSYANAAGMGSYPGSIGTSPTPESLNGKGGSSELGAGGRSSELVKIDPSLLRTGKANDIMGQFENKFGISRDSFAKSVMAGEDPRRIFGSAPRNALSNDDMNKATSAAKGMSEADKANALAGTGLAEAQKEMAGKLGQEQYLVSQGGGGSTGLASARISG